MRARAVRGWVRVAAVAGLLLVGCDGGGSGECNSDGECAGEETCVPQLVGHTECEPSFPPGLCVLECSTDADCGEGEVCLGRCDGVMVCDQGFGP